MKSLFKVQTTAIGGDGCEIHVDDVEFIHADTPGQAIANFIDIDPEDVQQDGDDIATVDTMYAERDAYVTAIRVNSDSRDRLIKEYEELIQKLKSV